MSQTNTIERKELFGHPVGLYILFFTELWERFSYYGMRAILVYYMVTSATAANAGLGWADGNALAIYGWYTMLVYVMSIPGGILADKFIGQKKSVMIGGLILVVGQSILAVDAVWAFYAGLLLIILGVGALKPNISTMVGGLYKPGDERRDQGFTIFYIGINIGAFLAALIVGAVGETYGWHYGFGLAGIGMALGQLVFIRGQKHLKGIGDAPKKRGKGDSLQTLEDDHTTSLGTLIGNLLRSPLHLIITLILVGVSLFLGFSLFSGYEVYAYSALFVFLSIIVGLMMMIYLDINKIEKDRFIVLLLSFLIVIVFWGAFEQAGGLMNLYTRAKIDRIVSLPILDIVFFGAAALLLVVGVYRLFTKKKQVGFLLGSIGIVVLIVYFILRSQLSNPYEIPGSVFQSVNPLFIMIFGTIVASFWLWWQHRGLEKSSLFKMAVGTIIMGVGFVFMAVAATQADAYGEKGMLILLILAYLFHTLGELSASPVALSFVTKVAPVKYVSLMMGLYFAATGLGNKVAGTIGEASQNEPIVVEMAAGHETDFRPFVEDSTLIKRDNFEVSTEMKVVDGHIQMTTGDVLINDLIVLGPEDEETLLDRIGDDTDQTYTGVLSFEPENSKDKTSPYKADVQIYEIQNRKEIKTFVMIFLFTAAFGILLLIFLKRLKKLTRGADTGELEMEEMAPEPPLIPED